MLRRLTASRTVRIGAALAAAGFGLLAVVGQWSQVRAAAGQLSLAAVAVAALAVMAGLFATMLSWRALLADLGSPLGIPAAMRVFYIGQLGKYVPGGVWWLVGQVELAHQQRVPRQRSAAAGVLTVVLSLGAGLGIAALTLPLLASPATDRYWPVLLAVPLLALVARPRVLNPALDRVLRRTGREPLEHPLSRRGLAETVAWAALAWAAFGVQVAVLAVDLGATGARTLFLSIGGFALAWSVGFLAVLVPAGIGVREAALVAALAAVLPPGPALLIAVVSRLLMTVGDLSWAAAAVARWPGGGAAPPRQAGSDCVEPV